MYLNRLDMETTKRNNEENALPIPRYCAQWFYLSRFIFRKKLWRLYVLYYKYKNGRSWRAEVVIMHTQASQVAQWWGIHLQCRRLKFDPWVSKISWRWKWQPPPVFLPGKSHGQMSLAGYSLWGHKESDTTYQRNKPKITHIHISNPCHFTQYPCCFQWTILSLYCIW